jgi:hypothetical protein
VIPGGWAVPSAIVGGVPVCTRAAAPGKQHVLMSVDVSFSTDPANNVLLEIFDGSTRRVARYLKTGTDVSFGAGITCGIGNALTVKLGSASPNAGGTGLVNMHGYTR